jgi:hypothetical protein
VIEPGSVRASTAIVLGPRAHDEVVAYTRRVLTHFEIPFTELDWRDFPALLARVEAVGLGVVVFATGVAYTDEHLRLPEDVNIPAVRFVADTVEPPTKHLLTGAVLMASTGYGADGAVKAALFAVRILAQSDPILRDLYESNPYPSS